MNVCVCVREIQINDAIFIFYLLHCMTKAKIVCYKMMMMKKIGAPEKMKDDCDDNTRMYERRENAFLFKMYLSCQHFLSGCLGAAFHLELFMMYYVWCGEMSEVANKMHKSMLKLRREYILLMYARMRICESKENTFNAITMRDVFASSIIFMSFVYLCIKFFGYEC